MGKGRGKKLFRIILFIGAAIPVFAAAALFYSYPVVAAVVCPSCFGMERASDRLVADKGLVEARRAALLADLQAARTVVDNFYGTSHRLPIVVACSTSECDHRLGGRGARAITLSAPFFTIVRVSPLGLNRTILAHEFSHVEAHQRIGLANQMSGTIPAWFDEGLAVIVSQDERYLRPGIGGAAGCLAQANPDSDLPASPFEWGRRAGREQMLYAHAACRVLRWMEANGGREGVLRALGAKPAGIVSPANQG